MCLPGRPAGLFTEENKVGQNTAQRGFDIIVTENLDRVQQILCLVLRTRNSHLLVHLLSWCVAQEPGLVMKLTDTVLWPNAMCRVYGETPRGAFSGE